MMKKVLIIVAAVSLTFLLTAFFYFTPSNIIKIANSYLSGLHVDYIDGSGNIFIGFKFSKMAIYQEKSELLPINNLKICINFPSLLTGKISFSIKSDEVVGNINLFYTGTIEGKLLLKKLYFDTAYFNFNENIQFSALLSGSLFINKNLTTLEIKTEELNWRKISISGIDLPFTLFSAAKGGVDFMQNKVVIKSINFEGEKGNARIVGEMAKGVLKLDLEIIPKDWNEPYLFQLMQYKQGPGFYKIHISF